ncbi:MAG: tripartite tricarboxylate transporter TctB family protein [Bacillota bacterium]
MLYKLLAPVIIFIGAFYLYFIQLNKINVMADGSNSLLLPKIILILLMGLSFILAIKEIWIYKDKNIQDVRHNKKLLFSILLSVLYLFLINIVGFFIVTPFFIYYFALILDYQKKKRVAIFAVIMTFIAYILFSKVLYIPLPMGISIFKNINEIIIF